MWKRLLRDKNLKPRNMHMWWELYEKYNDDMEKLEEEMELSTNKKVVYMTPHRTEAPSKIT